MASLNDQLNSFRNRVRNAPTIQRRVVEKREAPEADGPPAKRQTPAQPSPPSRASPSATGGPAAAAAAAARGGAHVSTQVVHATDYIKRAEKPVRFEDIESYLSFPVAPLLPHLRVSPNIRVNDAERTAQYVSVYDIYTADELLKFLRAQKSFQGVPVRALKDGWPGCLDAVESLERSGDVLVLRTKKENAPRLIWANTGGPVGGIDDKFLDLWKRTKVPSSSELPSALERARLKPTSVDPAKIKQQNAAKKGDERKQKKPRRSKITNTHLGRGILKDYGI